MSNNNGDDDGVHLNHPARFSLQQKVEAAETIREMARIYVEEMKDSFNLSNDIFRYGAINRRAEAGFSHGRYSSALQDQKEERFNYQDLAREGLATLAWIEQRALEHVMDGKILSGEFNDVEHFLKNERAHLYRRLGMIESRIASGIHNDPVIADPPIGRG